MLRRSSLLFLKFSRPFPQFSPISTEPHRHLSQLSFLNSSQQKKYRSNESNRDQKFTRNSQLFAIFGTFLITFWFVWDNESVKRHFRFVHPIAASFPDAAIPMKFKGEKSDVEKLNGEEKSGGESDPESHSECEILDEQQKKGKKKKLGFRERRINEYENRIRAYSSPDKIFRYFATLKMVHDEGNSYEIFMTPEDFVRSLTPGVMQPRKYGLDKFKSYRKGDPIPYSSKKNIFYWMGRDGLINYTDYLFLMTLLSTSPNDINLAFYVYDVNGDGHLDKEEFDRVQELLLNQSNVGQKHRDHSSMNMAFRKGASSALVKYFFGADGKEKLDVERFLLFQKDLHRDILQIEFERRDPESMPTGIISEIAFADLLLIHAALPEKRRQRMMKRVRRVYKQGTEKTDKTIGPEKRGVSFDEVSQYFAFLYQIEKVDMALHFYKLAGQPLTRDLLKKVAQRITNVELTDTVIDVVVTLFDENGDGLLSHNEFISVMKKRMNRGLERPKDTGFFRFIEAITECGKKQFQNLINKS